MNIIEKFKEEKEIYLRIKARPSAGQTQFKEVLDDGTIKMDISKPPEKGKANEELLKFLAQEFQISRKNVRIINGAGSKVKLIKISK